jgi:SAM-dependent methyltransferase
MHINSTLLFEKYCKNVFAPNHVVLEIGPNKHPSTYNEIVGLGTIHWQTLDIVPNDHLTYLANSEYCFPIPDNTFDVVLACQVIEHVRKPWVWIKELARVSKKGGHVVIINPVSWPYHMAPVDCWRIYPEGMRALYEEACLHVELSEMATLEPARSRNMIPGHGAVNKTITKLKPGSKKRYFEEEEAMSFKSLMIKIVRWPVTWSVDVVTIGTKI